MKHLNKIFVFIIFTLLSCTLIGQESIIKMNSNPALLKVSENVRTKTESDESIKLPFFDDFSYPDIYPSSLLWQDKDAYINNDYAYLPVSFGVATLDALDENGMIHSNLNAGVKAISDHLTSQPIRLDSIFGTENRKLYESDSVYFSFFFQPNYWDKIYTDSDGLPGDSLVVEFYSPIDEKWFHVWSTARLPFDSIIKPDENYGRTFVEVIIPITDEERYFHDGFQFRFKNYVELTNSTSNPGWQVNDSQWNVDYVFIDSDRRVNDFYKDICFVNQARSFLKNYNSMPYNQYSANYFNEMLDYDEILISNLDRSVNNVEYSYNVTNIKGEIIKQYDGGKGAINPFYTSGYYDHQSIKPYLALAPFPPALSGGLDSSEFLITHYISSDLEFKQNDTIRFEQKFHNYYAYDNGTPEYSYTLSTSGYAKVALEFKLNVADTLRAVNIFFNDIAKSNHDLYYTLCVWNWNGAEPDSLLYSQEIVIKKQEGRTKDFVTIMLDKPLLLNRENCPHMVFYVGLEKSATEEMALGFDISKNSSENTFYSVSGFWEQSIKKGTVMIRPVLGKGFVYSSIKEYDKASRLNVYPNPVRDGKITVKCEETIKDIYIYSSLGIKVFESKNEFSNIKSIVLNNLREGMYFIIVIDKNGLKHTEKIILIH